MDRYYEGEILKWWFLFIKALVKSKGNLNKTKLNTSTNTFTFYIKQLIFGRVLRDPMI